MALNTNLRTDAHQVTNLLDNVPSSFVLTKKGDECYYSFSCTDDLNTSASILVSFEGACRVYVSDTKKPQPSNCIKEFPDPAKPLS